MKHVITIVTVLAFAFLLVPFLFKACQAVREAPEAPDTQRPVKIIQEDYTDRLKALTAKKRKQLGKRKGLAK